LTQRVAEVNFSQQLKNLLLKLKNFYLRSLELEPMKARNGYKKA